MVATPSSGVRTSFSPGTQLSAELPDWGQVASLFMPEEEELYVITPCGYLAQSIGAFRPRCVYAQALFRLACISTACLADESTPILYCGNLISLLKARTSSRGT